MAFVEKWNSKYDKVTTTKKQKKLARLSGCKGTYSLSQFSNHDLNTPVEPMHLLKNVVEHVVRLLPGAEDSRKVRMEEKVRGRFTSSWAGLTSTKASRLPPAPFCLSTSEATIADARLQSIQVPLRFDWKPRALFTKNTVGMKSHSWKQLVSSHILKYCIRDLLGQRQRQTMFSSAVFLLGCVLSQLTFIALNSLSLMCIVACLCLRETSQCLYTFASFIFSIIYLFT